MTQCIKNAAVSFIESQNQNQNQDTISTLKIAHWIKNKNNQYFCSNCKTEMYQLWYNYCPNCGAKIV